MDSIGTQFKKIMDRRFALVVPRAAVPLTEEVFKRTTEMTRSGTMPFDGTGMRYDTPYMPKYAAYRRRQGRQTESVDLRLKARDIEVKARFDTKDYAEIGFARSGKIFKYHQDGITYKNGNNRQRTIFPKYWVNIPKKMYMDFIKLVVKVMNGE